MKIASVIFLLDIYCISHTKSVRNINLEEIENVKGTVSVISS